MAKWTLDLLISFFGLFFFSFIVIPLLILIWLYDFHSPLYISNRVGKGGRLFKMVKLRTMIVNADKTGVDSTSANDKRITPIGKFIRKYKLDEFIQLWNVLIGTMSLVGPRPNVKRETDLYTSEEKRLLSVKPGITDFSSIIFADEGEILKDSNDPDIDYNQLIRPWKSRLGLIYIDNQSFWLDIKLIALTALAFCSRKLALKGIRSILCRLNVDQKILDVALRQDELKPYPPPGSNKIVTSRALCL
jgi:lipopolysaccharide/colanic/teichoic acid biosynthesis glycosyltransferase